MEELYLYREGRLVARFSPSETEAQCFQRYRPPETEYHFEIPLDELFRRHEGDDYPRY